jgi:hypothetical protein
MNQEYISALKSERLSLLLVYIDNIYGLHLEGKTQILGQIENNLNFFTRSYTKTHHGTAITVWYFTFVKKTGTMNPREEILEPRYLFFHFGIFLQAKFFN